MTSGGRVMADFQSRRTALGRNIQFILKEKKAITKRKVVNLWMGSRELLVVEVATNLAVERVILAFKEDLISQGQGKGWKGSKVFRSKDRERNIIRVLYSSGIIGSS